jgi:hypothetical protein
MCPKGQPKQAQVAPVLASMVCQLLTVSSLLLLLLLLLLRLKKRNWCLMNSTHAQSC